MPAVFRLLPGLFLGLAALLPATGAVADTTRVFGVWTATCWTGDDRCAAETDAIVRTPYRITLAVSRDNGADTDWEAGLRLRGIRVADGASIEIDPAGAEDMTVAADGYASRHGGGTIVLRDTGEGHAMIRALLDTNSATVSFRADGRGPVSRQFLVNGLDDALAWINARQGRGGAVAAQIAPQADDARQDADAGDDTGDDTAQDPAKDEPPLDRPIVEVEPEPEAAPEKDQPSLDRPIVEVDPEPEAAPPPAADDPAPEPADAAEAPSEEANAEPAAEAEAEPELEAKAEADPETAPKAETKADAEPEAEADTAPETQAEAESEADSEAGADADTMAAAGDDAPRDAEADADKDAGRTEEAIGGGDTEEDTADTAAPSQASEETEETGEAAQDTRDAGDTEDPQPASPATIPEDILARHARTSDCDTYGEDTLEGLKAMSVPLTDGKSLHIVPCYAAGDTVASRLYVARTANGGDETRARTLYFANFSRSLGWYGSDTLIDTEFDAATGVLTAGGTGRGMGCGNTARYRWDGFDFRLLEYRASDDCTGPADPAQWPLIYSAENEEKS